MDVDPQIGQRIAEAARRVNVVKNMMERAKTFEERKLLQIELEKAEEEMQNVAMTVNRGVSRPMA